MKSAQMSAASTGREQNRLLATLSQEIRNRLAPNLETVNLSLGKVVHESGCLAQHIYFPNDSVVSLTNVTEEGELAEVCAVGNEGMVGIAALLCSGTTLTRAIVQQAGTADRLPVRLLKTELDRHDELMRLVLRYTQFVLTQVSQTAVCNRHHSIEQQVCRWLLLSVDRRSGDEVIMTHELLASSLGVRREGITTAAGYLRDLGSIRYHRGRITVLDRDALEELSCECYGVLKRERERLLPMTSNGLDRRTAHA
jgi:CRP-like cAMP-binding protein